MAQVSFYASGATKHYDLTNDFINSLSIASAKAKQDKVGFEVYIAIENVLVASVTPNGRILVTDYARTRFLKGQQHAFLQGKE